MSLVYKIVNSTMWRDAIARGRFDGSTDDFRDGFIHLSTADQLAGTIAAHFAGQSDLVLIAFDANALGAALRWEPSRGGELFPHLYGSLDPHAAVSVEELRHNDDDGATPPVDD